MSFALGNLTYRHRNTHRAGGMIPQGIPNAGRGDKNAGGVIRFLNGDCKAHVRLCGLFSFIHRFVYVNIPAEPNTGDARVWRKQQVFAADLNSYREIFSGEKCYL